MPGGADAEQGKPRVPLLKRRATTETDLVGVPVPSTPGQATSQTCSEPGCDGPDRVTCDYRDRRGTACPTAWCPQHIVTVGTWHVCRRHARLVQVLSPVEFRPEVPAPDLDNRTPSLASYLGDALDSRMRQLLAEVCRTAEGERVEGEPLYVVTTHDGRRRWAQGWKLFDTTGPLLRIDVEVDERDDPECAIRLNSRIILRCVPPWIEERRSGGPARAPDDVEKRRQAFYETLMEQHIRPAVIAEEHWVRRWERSPILATQL